MPDDVDALMTEKAIEAGKGLWVRREMDGKLFPVCGQDALPEHAADQGVTAMDVKSALAKRWQAMGFAVPFRKGQVQLFVGPAAAREIGAQVPPEIDAEEIEANPEAIKVPLDDSQRVPMALFGVGDDEKPGEVGISFFVKDKEPFETRDELNEAIKIAWYSMHTDADIEWPKKMEAVTERRGELKDWDVSAIKDLRFDSNYLRHIGIYGSNWKQFSSSMREKATTGYIPQLF
eukprot:g14010.t1